MAIAPLTSRSSMRVTVASLFDFQSIATMLGNGLTRVYTYNRSDFEKVHEIDVLTP